MAENPLMIKSKALCVEVRQICRMLRATTCDHGMVNLLFRSGSGIAANVKAALSARSKKEFENKMRLALEDTEDTQRWISGLMMTERIQDAVGKSLLKDCAEIKALALQAIEQA